MGDFKLSASLEGHEEDVRNLLRLVLWLHLLVLLELIRQQVRAVAFPHPSFVLSASRDKSVRLWKAQASAPPIYDGSFVSHGSDFVNSVAFVPPSPDFPEGLVVAGGRDAVIEVRQPSKLPQDNADGLLLGHAGNVCALVSGSWDTEARVWQIGNWESVAVLQGHTASVWAVSFYDKETILTGTLRNS